jgi:hypothetical protein
MYAQANGATFLQSGFLAHSSVTAAQFDASMGPFISGYGTVTHAGFEVYA